MHFVKNRAHFVKNHAHFVTNLLHFVTNLLHFMSNRPNFNTKHEIFLKWLKSHKFLSLYFHNPLRIFIGSYFISVDVGIHFGELGSEIEYDA